jgi:hypothetical protein
MKNLIMFCCCYFLQTNIAVSQNNFEIGQKWIYLVSEFIVPTESIDSVVISKDTLINGKTYLKFIASRQQPCFIFKKTQYVREEDGVIYRLSLDLTRELIVANTASQDSFTIQFDWLNGSSDSIYSALALVDSFGYETIYDGTVVRTQYMKIPDNKSYGENQTYTFYENIGFNGPGYIFADLGTGLCDPFVQFKLRCMIKGLDTLHFTKDDCQYIGMDSGIEEDVNLNIQPNPTFDVLNIPENYVFQKMMDIHGRVYHLDATSQAINLEGLPKGVYFVQCRKVNSHRSQSAKVVKW